MSVPANIKYDDNFKNLPYSIQLKRVEKQIKKIENLLQQRDIESPNVKLIDKLERSKRYHERLSRRIKEEHERLLQEIAEKKKQQGEKKVKAEKKEPELPGLEAGQDEKKVVVEPKTERNLLDEFKAVKQEIDDVKHNTDELNKNTDEVEDLLKKIAQPPKPPLTIGEFAAPLIPTPRRLRKFHGKGEYTPILDPQALIQEIQNAKSYIALPSKDVQPEKDQPAFEPYIDAVANAIRKNRRAIYSNGARKDEPTYLGVKKRGKDATQVDIQSRHKRPKVVAQIEVAQLNEAAVAQKH